MERSRRKPGVFLFGLFAYTSFAVSLAYLVGFLTNFPALPVTVDKGPVGPAWLAVAVDVFLIALFGLQHSIMARRSFKRRWTRIVPPAIERSVYVVVSSAVTLLLCLAWRPIPGLIWAADTMPMTVLAWTLFGGGLAVLFAASFQIDHWELLGLRQTWNDWRGTAARATEFTLRGFYRIVRHPIYVGWLLLFWVTPEMSVGHLLLAAGMTVYTMIAIRFEEGDLVSEFGARYQEYQRQVPALVPRPMAGRRAKIGRKWVRPVLALAFIGIALGAVRSWATVPEERLTVTVDGRERTAYVVAPAVADPGRLVLMLHGAGGSAERIRHFTAFGLERQAAAGNWVVAYPEGVGGTWNDCRKTLTYPARQLDVDDVGFLAALIDRLRSRYGIAPEDVWVAGFSNGGQMAIRLAMEQPGAVGGLAIVAAQLPATIDSVCSAPVPAIRSVWINGTEDPFIPPEGGASIGPDGSSLGGVLSHAETARAFADAARAGSAMPPQNLPEMDGDPSTGVIRKDWVSADGVDLRQYLLQGSGHVVPQRAVRLPPIVGPAAGDIDFGEVVEAFVNGRE